MSLLRFKKQVEELIRDWLLERGLPRIEEIPLEKPPQERYGEMATPLPFHLAKALKKPPYEIAVEMASTLKPSGLIARVEAAPPGYVNFHIDYRELASLVIRKVLEEGSNYGKMGLGRGKRVQVEHTSVNPNKALHIGHARNVILGTALANLLAFADYDVEVVNYIDDTGTQIADIVLGFLHLGFDPDKGDVKFDQYCGDYVYVKVTEMVEASPRLQELRAEILGRIDEGGNEVAYFAKEIAERVLMEQLHTCWRLGAEYDALIWESDILRSRLWEEAFKRLKELPLVRYEEEGRFAGCWVVKVPGKEGLEEVLVRSDGTTTYLAKDISTAMWKLGYLPSPFKFHHFVKQPSGKILWSTGEEGVERDFGSVEKSINVIDVRQARLQEVIKRLLEALLGGGERYIHYAYEVVSISRESGEKYLGLVAEKDFLHMSGRRGIYFNVDPTLDLMKKVVKEEALKRNPDLGEEELEEIGEGVAISSLKYPLLAMDLDKIVIFDVDRALNISEESGSYILYGYARAVRVLEKAEEPPKLEELEPDALERDEERRLLKAIAELELRVKEAVEGLDVKALARYTYHLTLLFNKFYESCPILTSGQRQRNIRLLLVKAYTQTIENLCRILALPLVEKM